MVPGQRMWGKRLDFGGNVGRFDIPLLMFLTRWFGIGVVLGIGGEVLRYIGEVDGNKRVM